MSFEPEITKVHEDARGRMYSISLPGDRELMLLFSAKGSLRGGHSHDVPESVLMLTGRMRYHKLDGEEVLGEGQGDFHEPGEVHMGEFLEDSWLIEWKICDNKRVWSNTDHDPYRERVRANAAQIGI